MPANGIAPLRPVARPTDEAEAQRKIANRLKRARGQLGGVIAALESGADCPATLTQLSAVSGAVNRAKHAVISSAMRECLTPADAGGTATGTPTIRELEKLFIKYA
nr:metal-sensitive transcriptional regulator [Marisediminicola antarctica]